MWRPIETLVAGRLAYLHFEDAGTVNCLGYVNGLGRAEWPDDINGRRPAGWREVSEILQMPAEGKLTQTSANL